VFSGDKEERGQRKSQNRDEVEYNKLLLLDSSSRNQSGDSAGENLRSSERPIWLWNLKRRQIYWNLSRKAMRFQTSVEIQNFMAEIQES